MSAQSLVGEGDLWVFGSGRRGSPLNCSSFWVGPSRGMFSPAAVYVYERKNAEKSYATLVPARGTDGDMGVSLTPGRLGFLVGLNTAPPVTSRLEPSLKFEGGGGRTTKRGGGGRITKPAR